jgi:hypothetical protein
VSAAAAQEAGKEERGRQDARNREGRGRRQGTEAGGRVGGTERRLVAHQVPNLAHPEPAELRETAHRTQRAACDVQHVTCSTRRAICNVHHSHCEPS